MKGRNFASAGAVFTALVSSACCWLPLALVGLGLSAVGVGAFFERFRTIMLALALVLLAVGFYYNYLRRERCRPGEACTRPNLRLRRFNRGVFWISVVFVAVFALFPDYAGTVFGSSPPPTVSPAASETWQLGIKGMTCAGCETTIATALAKVPGVAAVQADYQTGIADITAEPTRSPDPAALEAALERAGYSLVSIGHEAEKPR